MAIVFSLPYLIWKDSIKSLGALGYIGLITACAISNITIMIPSSSTIIVIAAASSLNPFLAIICGGLGTSIGEQSSYICGRIGRLSIDYNSEKENKIYNKVKDHGFFMVFLFAFLPLPIFDIVGIAAGVANMNWLKYAIAAVLGKILKFSIALIGIYYILPSIIEYIPHPVNDIIRRFLNELIPN